MRALNWILKAGRVYNTHIPMKHIALVFVIVSFLLFHPAAEAEYASFPIPSPVPTIEYSLPYPGILPTHPLYGIKTLRDRVRIAFTRDLIRKSQLQQLISDKHIVMGQMLWNNQEYEMAVRTFIQGEEYSLDAVESLAASKREGIFPPGQSDKLEMAIKKHEEIILEMISRQTDPKRIDSLNDVLAWVRKARSEISMIR